MAPPQSLTDISPGDIVILNHHGRGTFRTHAVLEQDDLLKMPHDIDVLYFAHGNLERVKRSRNTFGASLVLSEEELDSTSEREEKRISLALDSVFKKERPNSKRHFSSGLPSWVAFSAEPSIRNHKKQERNPNLSRPHKAQKLMASAFSPSDPSPPPRGEDLGLNPSRPPKHYSTGPWVPPVQAHRIPLKKISAITQAPPSRLGSGKS
ncbi:hypothetical protein PABG_05768 [Paracoccidioides brasiliensis Pb03]|nr:hypothetical protein PABG_05768 [Paracoccidioides brasiliensis Pb03]